MIAVVKLRILPPMDIVMDAVQDACEEVLDTGSRAELEQVQQEIITIQEAVLVLHKDQQQGMLSNEDYDLKVAVYSQQMDTLQERQRELIANSTNLNMTISQYIRSSINHSLPAETNYRQYIAPVMCRLQIRLAELGLHLDGSHVHVHIVMNTTSFMDGHQYHGGLSGFMKVCGMLKKKYPQYRVNLCQTRPYTPEEPFTDADREEHEVLKTL